MDYDQFFADKLNELHETGEYRVFAPLKRQEGKYPKVWHQKLQKEVTIWCSNNYLAMGQNPKIINAMHDALDECGAGAGGTRNISGTNHYHVMLEDELAKLHEKQNALLFTSGYIANWSVLATLGRHLEGCQIFSDSNNHASMIEGIRHSKAQKYIWKHNDTDDLERLLKKAHDENPNNPKIVAFESVYSMDGDIAPIKDIIEICEKYNALSYLDEVHAVGLYGKHGAGIAQEYGVMDKVTIIQGTLGKTFGTMGGYIAGSNQMIDFIRSFASGFIFSTALPPVIAAGALECIRYLKHNDFERQKQKRNVKIVRQKLNDIGLPCINNESHIIPVMVKDPKKCKILSDLLLENYNIYVQPINYPTVPKGTERLRLTPSPAHTKQDIDHLVDSLSQLWSQCALARAVA